MLGNKPQNRIRVTQTAHGNLHEGAQDSHGSSEEGSCVSSYKNPEGFHGEGELLADQWRMVRNLNGRGRETSEVELASWAKAQRGEGSGQEQEKNSHAWKREVGQEDGKIIPNISTHFYGVLQPEPKTLRSQVTEKGRVQRAVMCKRRSNHLGT